MSKNTNIADLINYISVDGSGNVVLSTGQLVATQNYVTTAVSNLVASAPSTLDTLNELATALGNDANFATTVTNSIATKLPLSGGTLTGNLNGTGATFSSDLFALMGVFTRNSADTFIGSSNNTSGIIVNGNTLVTKIVSGGNTVATFASNSTATFSGSYGTSNGININGSTYATLNSNRGASSASAGVNYSSLSVQKWFTGIYENTDNFGFYSVGFNGFPLTLNYSSGAASMSAIDTSGNRTSPFNVLTLTADNNSNPYNGFGAALVFRNMIYSGGPSAGGIRDGARIRTNINTNSTDALGTDLVFDVASTQTGSFVTAMTLRYNGLVGIGTISPTEPLSVSFASHGLISQHRQSSGVGVGQNFFMKFNTANGTAASYAGIYADIQSNTDGAHSGKMILQVANAGSLVSALTIMPNNNIGIGNTSPLQALGKTITVEGTGIFQSTAGGGNYNENLRLNRTGNNYSAIAMGGAYNSTSGSGVGVWTIAATPSGTNYRFDFDYNGGTKLAFRTDGQIIQNGVGIVQIVPIGPNSHNIPYTATINGQYAIGSTSIPSTARWLLADVFITANISDHQNFMLTRQNFGTQKTWVDTRGNNPDSEFGNLTQDDVAILTYNGESDGYTPNYGVWKSSVLIPSSGRNIWINNYGNSNSNGYIYFIVRGYSL